jgi:large subunit ribosomal protein L29
MKIKQLRELTPDELQAKHDDLWTEVFGMRIKHALGQLENPLLLRGARRDIARVKTLLTQHGVEEKSRRRHNVRPAGVTASKGKAAKSAKPAAGAK